MVEHEIPVAALADQAVVVVISTAQAGLVVQERLARDLLAEQHHQ
jgi:hypothetical protein